MQQKNDNDTSFDFKLLIKVIKLALNLKGLLFLTILYAIIIAILVPLRPELFQRLIDNGILGEGNNIQIIVIAIISSLIAETFFQYLFNYSSSLLGQSVVKDLRTKVFNHVINLKLSYFDKTPIGTTTTRTVNDIETINDIFTQGFIRLIADILTLIFIASWMLVKNWKLALISMIALPIMIFATYIFKESVKSAFQKVRTQVALLNAFLQEHITGMSLVQIFSAEEQELKKFKDINEQHKKANIEAIWAYSIFFPVVEVLLAIATGLMVWFGANLLIQNKLFTASGQIASVGLIVQFILLINALFRPIRFMAERFNTMQMGLVAANRVFNLLDKKEFIEDNGTIDNKSIEGKIEFKNVDFAYIADDYVLKNVSFTIPAGKTLAIVGQTGSGKSSIINLLTRLYEWQNGDILLDNISVKDYKLDFYRKQMSTVLQDVFLFSGSVLDNIRLLNENFTEEQVVNASKLIGAHEFIDKLPNGYHYQVMERGATLSLGQRQLISFVRALVFNPKILILDEATSSIDTETEYVVQSAIDKLIKNRTSIVIAHRLATIKNADYVLMLKNGKILDFGEKEVLLNTSDSEFKAFLENH